jgi:succinylarginine dihydrolase
MSQRVWEVNFDGLIGPTHHYGGLSGGNPASMAHGLTVSNPREAALQGLEKMRLLLGLGLKQGVFPPQERPDTAALRRLGFGGSEEEALAEAHRVAPGLLAACWSASSMWAANAATVSPARDTADARVHFTPANLAAHFHRSIEAPATARLLKTVFPDETLFAHHAPLPAGVSFADEGAANHMRLCGAHEEPGVALFVYGRRAGAPPTTGPRRYPARQTRETSRAVARLHRLDPERTVFARQSAAAIDAGVFHHDVAGAGNADVLLVHTHAFADRARTQDEIERKFARCAGRDLTLIEISPDRLSLAEAVKTYFFNSQLVSLPGGGMCLIAPADCLESRPAREALREIEEGDNPIRSVRFVDIRQSMKNGGGPACLRLRVVLSEAGLAAVRPGCLLTDALLEELIRWVERRYRDRIHPGNLADPALAEESRAALDELTRILRLGSIYPFQGGG